MIRFRNAIPRMVLPMGWQVRSLVLAGQSHMQLHVAPIRKKHLPGSDICGTSTNHGTQALRRQSPRCVDGPRSARGILLPNEEPSPNPWSKSGGWVPSDAVGSQEQVE
jgi:hypothetical protein